MVTDHRTDGEIQAVLALRPERLSPLSLSLPLSNGAHQSTAKPTESEIRA